MDLIWTIKEFKDLDPFELYAILQLRSEVFVVEQTCVFQDIDDRDQPSHHLMVWRDKKLVAYTRLVPAGIAYPVPSIGRVVTSPTVRGTGLGRTLMEKSIIACQELFGNTEIKISAQYHLKNFYGSLGFEQTGDIYLEDNIEHIAMLLHS